ncbi:MAG: hypothetical protein V7711_16005 [Pseudomonadales bacterium]
MTKLTLTRPHILIIAALASSLALTNVYASPSSCTQSGHTIYCSADQSAGIQSGIDFDVDAGGDSLELDASGITSDIGTSNQSVGIAVGISDDKDVSTFNLTLMNSDRTISVDRGIGILVSSSSDDGSSSNDSGNTGDDARSLSLALDTSIEALVGGIVIANKAGDGGDGEGGVIVYGDGYKGGDGGDGGKTAIVASGIVTVESAGYVVSVEQSGGDGGDASNGGINSTGQHGGDGGSGGEIDLGANTSDDAPLSDDGDWDLSTSGNPTAVIMLQGQGGDGGDGGSASGDGGNGGDGGSGALIKVQSENDATFAVAANGGGVGIGAYSQGGDGGDGGNGDIVADGGEGGDGGDGGTVSIDNFIATIDTLGDSAPGILAKSVGGDGGDAGDGEVFSAGGSGGTGGAGGYVEVRGSAVISTEGTQSHGVAAYSVGGDGGDGGEGVFCCSGGDGGYTSDGGTVYVSLDSDSRIDTSGGQARGIDAQSNSGDGGAGGDADFNLVTFGASGGSAGDGGSIIIENDARIETAGDQSEAILAQSVGGGGGNGGGAWALFWAESGDGAIGGNGGTVGVTNTGQLNTYGSDADGINAQSIGGTGGNGGTTGGFIALGGKASGSSYGESVYVSNSGVIVTGLSILGGDRVSGPDPDCDVGCSYGILAQSIGGGGGNASSAGGVVAIGGVSGGGGDGGSVTVINSGEVITLEDDSPAIAAQSIGGGGGTSHGTGGLVAIGGSGGDGGDGGDVEITLQGDGPTYVSSEGANSTGILAQSIGGGGGNGSDATAISVDFAVAVGGDGGAGGAGGIITMNDTTTDGNSVETDGDNSDGISLQSIGGGGGKGGNAIVATGSVGFDLTIGASGDGAAGGDGGAIVADVASDIVTKGDNATGLDIQSIGGGGGDVGLNVAYQAGASAASASVAVGGDSGGGGNGADIDLTFGGTISTKGEQSTALSAISIGGGGGNAGTTVSGSALSVEQFSLAIGGSGGAGGDGGEVDVTAGSGELKTSGVLSIGLLAQSIGGGGGNAGSTIAADGLTSNSLDISVGGNGGVSGESGEVTIDSSADIVTEGILSGGLIAQSLAGSGGNGALTISGAAFSGTVIGVSTGGSGGAGGTASKVKVTQSGAISTVGDIAPGITAQSMGGAGGNSALSIAADAVSGGAIQIGIAGSGGDGGSSAKVVVDSQGPISTQGTFSSAILAQSSAGGGGSAVGNASVTGLAVSSVAVSYGGDGGGGGDAGKVEVTSSGDLSTTGIYSPGITAQSIGGVGGTGGFASTGGLDVASEADVPAINIATAFGGQGGAGGTAKDVTVVNEAGISTADYASYGILAQSLGGDGGYGGSVYMVEITGSNDVEVSIDIARGGDGGDGGIAGDISITNKDGAVIETIGTLAHGIVAQSIGGDGGIGGDNIIASVTATSGLGFNATLSVGGQGGDGALGGDIEIYNIGDVKTEGPMASGIFAQSIGGNGGDGGSVGSLILTETFGDSDSSVATASANFGIGGYGGSGMEAGTVFVENYGAIETNGTNANGIFAQSIGGGGGSGGNAAVSNMSLSSLYQSTLGSKIDDKVQVSVQLSVGGDGGAAGDGNSVTIINNSDISTNDIISHGIYAQSVGGGGGSGGDADSSIATALASSSDVPTTGALADLSESFDIVSNAASVVIFATDPSSIIEAWDIKVGGSGGASGDGGIVDVINNSSIDTVGDYSFGIYAQSVGGGGGNGGNGVGRFATQLEVGGDDGAGGDGGEVDVDNIGDIVTEGAQAIGIFAQSVGGGGGSAGDLALALDGTLDELTDLTDQIANSGTVSSSGFSIGISVLIQPDGGAGGDGGAVTITSPGDISTHGDFAHGIFAQSIGGGGGASGISNLTESLTTFTLNSLAGSTGDVGSGGDVEIDVDGDITVSGYGATAIFAQSVGGSSDGSDGSKAGDISIDIGGDITASGEAARGIFAQSGGSDGNGKISITVEDGASMFTDTDGYETITFVNGVGNILTNYGSIEKSEDGAVNGYVIAGRFGDVTVDNYGTISGSISFDDQVTIGGGNVLEYANVINNYQGATLNTGYELNLGNSSSVFNNYGTLSPLGMGTIGTTMLTGLFNQSSDGEYLVDLSMGSDSWDGSSDLLILGDSQGFYHQLDGTVSVNLIGDNLLASGESGSVVIAASTEENFNLSASVLDSSTVDYTLSSTIDADGNETVELGYEINFEGVSVSSQAVVAQSAVPQAVSFSVASDDSDTVTLTSQTADVESVSSAVETDTQSSTLGTSNLLGFAGHLDDLVGHARANPSASDADVAFITDLVNQVLSTPTFAQLDTLYQDLIAEELSLSAFTVKRQAMAFHRSMQSCPRYGEDNRPNFNEEGQCVWAQIGGTYFEQSETENRIGYEEDGWGAAGGAQFALSDNWFAGFGFGYDHRQFDSADFDNLEEEAFHIGASLRWENRDWSISTVLSGGFFEVDSERLMSSLGHFDVFTSEHEGEFMAWNVEAGRRFSFGDWYVKPVLGASLIKVWQDGFTENEPNGLAVRVDALNHSSVVALPAVEIGTDTNVFGGSSHLYLRAGAIVYVSGRETEVDFRFAGLSDNAPAMTLVDEPDRTYADLALGADIDLGKGWSLSLVVDSAISDNSWSIGGYGVARLRF